MKTTIINNILEAIEPGDEIYTISDSSSSNMTGYVRCFIVFNGGITEITMPVARRINYTYNKSREAISVHGCGFDRSYDVVYALSLALFPADKTGYKLKHRRM